MILFLKKAQIAFSSPVVQATGVVVVVVVVERRVYRVFWQELMESGGLRLNWEVSAESGAQERGEQQGLNTFVIPLCVVPHTGKEISS